MIDINHKKSVQRCLVVLNFCQTFKKPAAVRKVGKHVSVFLPAQNTVFFKSDDALIAFVFADCNSKKGKCNSIEKIEFKGCGILVNVCKNRMNYTNGKNKQIDPY